jgi:GNAT superfamily N-acetyltransferase
VDEQVVISGVLNMARMWEAPARTMGGRRARWDDAWAADSALPTRLFNRVTVLRRLDPSAAPELTERIIRFFGAQQGGGEYLVNDPWATLDLEPYGFSRWWTLPFMVREPGDTARGRSDVEIREVRSKSEFVVFVHALVEGFAIPVLSDVPTSRVMDERVLAGGAMRCWVAFADGQPVGTSVAYLSDGIVGVYLVAVLPRMRRQGVGEALTWRATLTDPTAPSTLQASALGQPLYERMGYVTALDCATWIMTLRDDAL